MLAINDINTNGLENVCSFYVLESFFYLTNATLNIKAIRSSETSVSTSRRHYTRHHNQHSQWRQTWNLIDILFSVHSKGRLKDMSDRAHMVRSLYRFSLNPIQGNSTGCLISLDPQAMINFDSDITEYAWHVYRLLQLLTDCSLHTAKPLPSVCLYSMPSSLNLWQREDVLLCLRYLTYGDILIKVLSCETLIRFY